MKRLLLVVGAGRSGSTLLDMLLSRYQGVAAAGEIRYLWDRGVLDHQLCSCSKDVWTCDVWAPVVESCSQEEAEHRVALQVRVDRVRRFPGVFLKWLLGRLPADVHDYARQEYAAMRAFARATDAETLIDSSKYPGRALALLAAAPSDVAVHVLWLVRDVRAVAYSWTTVKTRPEIVSGEETMSRHAVWYSAVLWSVLNQLALMLKIVAPKGHFHLLRYEDLVQDPDGISSRILETLGVPEPRIGAVTDLHSVSGNPVRFRGLETIQQDSRWKRGLAKPQQWLAMLLGAPFMLGLGYHKGRK